MYWPAHVVRMGYDIAVTITADADPSTVLQPEPARQHRHTRHRDQSTLHPSHARGRREARRIFTEAIAVAAIVETVIVGATVLYDRAARRRR